MTKRREMIENNNPRDHIEYVEICKAIKKKAREYIRKHNLDEIRETSKSLKKARRTHNLEKKPDDNTTGQTRQRDPRTR